MKKKRLFNSTLFSNYRKKEIGNCIRDDGRKNSEKKLEMMF